MLKGLKLAVLAILATTLFPLAANAYQTTRKFHPGHYSVILPVHNGQQKYMDDARRPGMRGIMKRYPWRQLEPTQGNYNFSMIQSDLNWAQAYGMQLIIMIEDKSFTTVRPNPAYLDAVSPRNHQTGYTMLRWNPTVVARYKALVSAMGQRFDSHPNFEGIAQQESALGLDAATRQRFGYTPEKNGGLLKRAVFAAL